MLFSVVLFRQAIVCSMTVYIMWTDSIRTGGSWRPIRFMLMVNGKVCAKRNWCWEGSISYYTIIWLNIVVRLFNIRKINMLIYYKLNFNKLPLINGVQSWHFRICAIVAINWTNKIVDVIDSDLVPLTLYLKLEENYL